MSFKYCCSSTVALLVSGHRSVGLKLTISSASTQRLLITARGVQGYSGGDFRHHAAHWHTSFDQRFICRIESCASGFQSISTKTSTATAKFALPWRHDLHSVRIQIKHRLAFVDIPLYCHLWIWKHVGRWDTVHVACIVQDGLLVPSALEIWYCYCSPLRVLCENRAQRLCILPSYHVVASVNAWMVYSASVARAGAQKSTFRPLMIAVVSIDANDSSYSIFKPELSWSPRCTSSE